MAARAGAFVVAAVAATYCKRLEAKGWWQGQGGNGLKYRSDGDGDGGGDSDTGPRGRAGALRLTRRDAMQFAAVPADGSG